MRWAISSPAPAAHLAPLWPHSLHSSHDGPCSDPPATGPLHMVFSSLGMALFDFLLTFKSMLMAFQPGKTWLLLELQLFLVMLGSTSGSLTGCKVLGGRIFNSLVHNAGHTYLFNAHVHEWPLYFADHLWRVSARRFQKTLMHWSSYVPASFTCDLLGAGA